MAGSFDFKTIKGKEFSFFVPEPADMASFFVFSLVKAGSTLLMKVIADVCKKLSIPVVDLPTHLFNLGLQPTELGDDINSIWQERGYAYVGFRLFFPSMRFDLSKTKNILLVRDPRDMLVSLYFSLKYSHYVPELEGKGQHPLVRQRAAMQNTDINSVIHNMAPSIKKHFENYIKNLPAETTRVYRYEDIIFKKREWLEDMLHFLGIKLAKKHINVIADRHDMRPDTEDPKKHIRQVTPGNYKNHLAEETIEKLNNVFRPVLRYFHYDSVVSMEMLSAADASIAKRKFADFAAQTEYVHQLERDLEAVQNSWLWRFSSFLSGK